MSATSADLGMLRESAEMFLTRRNIHPVTQESFPASYKSIRKSLYEKIKDCDAVICVVGSAYGKEPTDSPTRRSFTQLEYDIAVKLRRPLFPLLTHVKFSALTAPINEGKEEQELQLQYRKELEGRHHPQRFSNEIEFHDQLNRILPDIEKIVRRKAFKRKLLYGMTALILTFVVATTAMIFIVQMNPTLAVRLAQLGLTYLPIPKKSLVPDNYSADEKMIPSGVYSVDQASGFDEKVESGVLRIVHDGKHGALSLEIGTRSGVWHYLVNVEVDGNSLSGRVSETNDPTAHGLPIVGTVTAQENRFVFLDYFNRRLVLRPIE